MSATAGAFAGTVRWRDLALLLLLCLALFLPGFFTLPPVDRDEARFAQASRQLLESGDWVDIRFQAEPRYKKPIAIYWLQAAAAALTDRAAIWTYRLPSLLGAILATLLTAALGAWLFDRPTGRRAALVLAAAPLLAVEARLATTDAALLAASVLVLAMLARAYRADPGTHLSWRETLLLWGALGVGLLLKGPVVLLVAGSTAAALAIADRDARWLARLRPWPGVGFAVLIVAPWLIAIQLASGGAFLDRSLGDDLLAKLVGAQESHGALPGYYLLAFCLGLTPFTPLAIRAVPWAWRQRRDRAVRFCLAWLLPSWLVFELAPTKLPHYALPLLPALALLAAAALASPPPSARWRGSALAIGTIVAVGLAGATIALPWRLEGRIDPAMLVGAAAALAATLAGYAMLERGRTAAALAALALAALLQNLTVFELALPRLPSLWIAPRLAALLAAEPPCPGVTPAVAGLAEPSLVFALGTATRLVDGAGAAAALLHGPACARAAVERAAADDFRAAVAAGGRQAEALARLDGFNYSKGRPVTLTLYRLAPP